MKNPFAASPSLLRPATKWRPTLAQPTRRHGQALILAVTIMLLAALLSAGFLLVVSGNLNSTARLSDKTRAIEAARSGLTFVNDRLTYSADGENWFAKNFDAAYFLSVPATNYSPTENAQGWNASTQFVKFPNQAIAQADAPHFLAKVKRIPNTLLPTDPKFDKRGMLEITVIGRSLNNEAVYSKTVAYKGGQEAPIGRFMRTVTNWNFDKKLVPRATATYNGTNLIATTAAAFADFPEVPFSVVIRNDSDDSLVGAVVQSKTPATLGLAQNPYATAPSVSQPLRVELAAALGAPNKTPSGFSAIDYNGNGTLEALEVEDYDVALSGAGGVRSNGSLWLFGDTNSANLDAKIGFGSIKSSGLIIRDTPSGNVEVQGISVSGTPLPAQSLASSSKEPTFPAPTAAPWPLTAKDADSLVSDAFNRIKASEGSTEAQALAPKSALRSVDHFTPPDIFKGAGLRRYRDLAIQPGNIYINNPGDVEKTLPAAPSATPRPMNQEELTTMWLSPIGITNSYTRTAAPAPTPIVATDPQPTLEDRHLRGWVGQDEFRARGALVELIDGAPAKIAVTLDARSDGVSGVPNGPDPAKSWGGAANPGTYRKEFPWPTDGVIYAAGNIRIRGTLATDPPRSLTVVAGNNIYIEGSLKAGTKKTALIARKNVVANPTAIVSRVEGYTLTTTDATLGDTNLPVVDADVFQVGDWINLDGQPGFAARVTAVDPTIGAENLTLDTVPPVDPAANTIMRAATAPLTKNFSKVGRARDVFQRRFPNTDATGAPLTQARLGLRHSAEKREAFEWSFTTPPSITTPPNLRTKTTGTLADVVMPATYKKIIIDQQTGTDTFDLADLVAIPETSPTLAQLASTIPPPMGSPGWLYTPTVLSSYDSVYSSYLAGVGARRNMVTLETGAYPWPQNLTMNPKTLVATSLLPSLDGGTTTLITDKWGDLTVAPTPAPNFGFNPTINGSEDVLTTDASFYTADADNKFALDSRVLKFATAPTSPTSTFALALPRLTGGLETQFQDNPNYDYDPTFVPTPTPVPNPIPYYRVAALKLENSEIRNDTTGNFGYIKPGYVMNINAFVYAQEGSWFVIPEPSFDPDLADPASTAIEKTDYNRDGIDATTDPTAAQNQGENAVKPRFLRYNYKVDFTGAIAENRTAIVNTAGTVPGAVAAWSDGCATYDATPPILPATAIIGNEIGVTYNFDPSVVNGYSDDGFKLPQSPDLIYQD